VPFKKNKIFIFKKTIIKYNEYKKVNK